MTRTTVITANVWSHLAAGAANRCLELALDRGPDIIGLQEWRLLRAPLLARTGTVTIAGSPMSPRTGRPMTWIVSSLGDCVVGLRSSRYTVTSHRQVCLGGVRRADPRTRWADVLPPRWATLVEARDNATAQDVAVVVFHLVPGAQARGAYRADRPRTAAKHAAETRALRRTVNALLARHDEVWAVGDSNFHGLALPGLVSAWADRPGRDGTLGSYRRIDDVFATRSPARLVTFATESDHRSVAVDYDS